METRCHSEDPERSEGDEESKIEEHDNEKI